MFELLLLCFKVQVRLVMINWLKLNRKKRLLFT